jgi:FHS family L-fucose permease-like MFS transporter
MKKPKSYTSAFIMVTLLFLLWGFITVLVDSLIPRLKEVFNLNYFQAGMVQFAFFAAFFVLSVPTGIILRKIGYQKGIVLGLVVMAIGCLIFYPAASERMFGIFMLGYFVLASGITILQVAANPYVAVLGNEHGASSRLNLSQAFNSFGTFIAPIIGSIYLLSDTVMSPNEIAALDAASRSVYYANEALTVQTPFLIIAGCILALAVLFFLIKLPRVLNTASHSLNFNSLFDKKSLVLGAAGIFFYVGAEVAIGSYLVNYFMDMNLAGSIKNHAGMMRIANSITGLFNTSLDQSDPKALLGIFVIFYWGGAMIGRFIGAYLTRIISPSKVLRYFACAAIVLVIISMASTGLLSMWSILAVGLFNSIMFPTIFTEAIEGMGDLKPQASGILCAMILGGAIIPPLYGLLTDYFGFKTAFVLVVLCYVYIGYFASKKHKTPAA